MSRDLRRALIIVWLILSTAALTAVAAPFVLPPGALFGAFPECSARARGSSCVMCGMTTAFVRMAEGDFASARDVNRGSVALWSGSVLNATGAMTYLFLKIRRK